MCQHATCQPLKRKAARRRLSVSILMMVDLPAIGHEANASEARVSLASRPAQENRPAYARGERYRR
jgi:hypothetical protein